MSEQEKKCVTVSRTFKLDVSTEVKELCAENPNRIALNVWNNGSGAVYLLSAQNLTYADGFPIAAGGSRTDNESTNAYWIIAASGTQNLRVEVISLKA